MKRYLIASLFMIMTIPLYAGQGYQIFDGPSPVYTFNGFIDLFTGSDGDAVSETNWVTTETLNAGNFNGTSAVNIQSNALRFYLSSTLAGTYVGGRYWTDSLPTASGRYLSVNPTSHIPLDTYPFIGSLLICNASNKSDNLDGGSPKNAVYFAWYQSSATQAFGYVESYNNDGTLSGEIANYTWTDNGGEYTIKLVLDDATHVSVYIGSTKAISNVAITSSLGDNVVARIAGQSSSASYLTYNFNQAEWR